MGGVDGRALRARRSTPGRRTARARRASVEAISLALPEGGASVRIVEAAHRDRFTDEAWTALTSERFVITPQSNRMGYRLDGPRARAQSWRGPLVGGDADWGDPGTGVRCSDPVDGRSADDRRVSHNRQRDHGRPSAGRPARARRLDRVRARARSTTRSRPFASVRRSSRSQVPRERRSGRVCWRRP